MTFLLINELRKNIAKKKQSVIRDDKSVFSLKKIAVVLHELLSDLYEPELLKIKFLISTKEILENTVRISTN